MTDSPIGRKGNKVSLAEKTGLQAKASGKGSRQAYVDAMLASRWRSAGYQVESSSGSSSRISNGLPNCFW